MLLRVQADDEAGDVDNLLSDADVALLDEHAGVVDRLGQAELVHAGLQAAFEKVLDLEREHIIEFHAGFVEHSNSNETANQGIAFEEALGVFLIEGEKLTRITDISTILFFFSLSSISPDSLDPNSRYGVAETS